MPTRGPTPATSPPSPASSISCSRARPSPASPTGSAGSCTQVRRSSGTTCAARSGARSPGRSSTRAGPTRSSRRRSSRQAGRSRSTPATSTARSGRWPGSSARRCQCGWWRTPNTGTVLTPTSMRGSAKSCASARTHREVLDKLALARHRILRCHADRGAPPRGRRPQAAHGAGAAYGGRAAQSQFRRIRAAVQAPHPGIARDRHRQRQ